MAQQKPHPHHSRDPLVETLSRSQIYLDYEQAFTAGTGLPLSLHGPEMLHLVRYPRNHKSPFCALVAKTNKVCGACYALQQQLAAEARIETRTLKCFAGLCESAVPVRVSENLLAFLQTGQVFLHRPTRHQFNRVSAILLKWGAQVDLKSLEEAFFHTRVIAPGQYQALLRLLTIFAGHLAACGNKLLLQGKVGEPLAVAQARSFIEAHHTEDLSLANVARAVNTSATYFSRRFKEATGMTFVDCVARVRVEKAKNLLQNPNLQISAIAFDVGFQSLSQFNRTFKKITGKSPTQYRAR